MERAGDLRQQLDGYLERLAAVRQANLLGAFQPTGNGASHSCLLLVDDVFDRGETLAAIVAWAEQAGAGRVLTSVLVDKQVEEPRPLRVDFAALSCPDRYLFGCGMDYQGYWRNLPAIYVLPEALESA